MLADHAQETNLNLAHLILVRSCSGRSKLLGILCGCFLQHVLILPDKIVGSPSVGLPSLGHLGQAPGLVPEPADTMHN